VAAVLVAVLDDAPPLPFRGCGCRGGFLARSSWDSGVAVEALRRWLGGLVLHRHGLGSTAVAEGCCSLQVQFVTIINVMVRSPKKNVMVHVPITVTVYYSRHLVTGIFPKCLKNNFLEYYLGSDSENKIFSGSSQNCPKRY
jgi:hypothetical protein